MLYATERGDGEMPVKRSAKRACTAAGKVSHLRQVGSLCSGPWRRGQAPAVTTGAGGFWEANWRMWYLNWAWRKDTGWGWKDGGKANFPAVGNIMSKGMETGNCKRPSKSMSAVGEKSCMSWCHGTRARIMWLGGGARGNLHKFGDPPKDSGKRGESMGAEHSPAVAPRRWRPERKVLLIQCSSRTESEEPKNGL